MGRDDDDDDDDDDDRLSFHHHHCTNRGKIGWLGWTNMFFLKS